MDADPAAVNPLMGGSLLAQVSTSIDALLDEQYGLPLRAKTYVLEDFQLSLSRARSSRRNTDDD
jgi:hypothetical protein